MVSGFPFPSPSHLFSIFQVLTLPYTWQNGFPQPPTAPSRNSDAFQQGPGYLHWLLLLSESPLMPLYLAGMFPLPRTRGGGSSSVQHVLVCSLEGLSPLIQIENRLTGKIFFSLLCPQSQLKLFPDHWETSECLPFLLVNLLGWQENVELIKRRHDN